MPECETQEPDDVPVESGHEIHCHLFDDEIMADKDETERPQVDIIESDD
jgi:hypothetical protein